MVADILFYIFSGVLILSSLAVILARNPVHSVLFLIFTFFNAAALFLLLGAELLAMLLIIIYVGAVAVLFLFIVMMLNIERFEFKGSKAKIFTFGIFFVAVLVFEIFTAYKYSSINRDVSILKANPHIHYPMHDELTNSEQVGMVLYTDFVLQFQMAGLILLVAMVGAVALTLRSRKNVRKQIVSEQVSRTRSSSVKLVKVLSNKGI